ncbi:SRPBCC family protein [Aquipuribacter sp. SD81]|uniref:SRPBCC family protein n=1 Tax=Aquipuribacter sp. SD81 TaxID=3127703 RepID=UPI003017E744
MTAFEVAREVAATPEQVWARLTDWPSHSRWAPGTTVRVLTPRADGVGARFVGRTSLATVGLDRIGFDDPMEVVRWEPPRGGGPGFCEVRKLGRHVRGRARFAVEPVGTSSAAPPRTWVVWWEDIEVGPRALRRLTGPLVPLAGRLAFGGVLRALAREVEAERR